VGAMNLVGPLTSECARCDAKGPEEYQINISRTLSIMQEKNHLEITPNISHIGQI
jgi:hypothetical protein